MKYTTLGNTDLKVSKICLGTMTFGEQNTESDGHAQLDYALEQGINFIDTAELYSVPTKKETQGSTEKIIGTWINSRKNRDQFILASKIAGPSPNLTYIRNPMGFSREQLTSALEGSLHRLQTDYIDLYQLHWPERKTNFFGRRGYLHREDEVWKDNFLEILEVMNDFISAGKIRHFGISNETPWGLTHFLHLADKHELPRCRSVQNPYSLLNRLYEVGMAEISIREDVGLLAYSPMAFGLLSGKYHQGGATENSRINKYKTMSRYNSELCKEATGLYLKVAEKYHTTLAKLSLAYVNSRPFVTSNIIGATTMEQLQENIDSINLEVTPEMAKDIEKIHGVIPNPAP